MNEDNSMKCDNYNCTLAPYSESKYCVLHCLKNDYDTDLETGLLEKFNDELIEYIAKIVSLKIKPNNLFSREHIIKYLKGDDSSFDQEINHFIRNPLLEISDIKFPSFDISDKPYLNYIPVLLKFGFVYFVNCQFWSTSLFLLQTQHTFDKCVFQVKWTLSGGTLLKDYYALYKGCTFKELVSTSKDEHPEINYPVFKDCQFDSDIQFDEIIFNEPIFNNTKSDTETDIEKVTDDKLRPINSMTLNRCRIMKNFSLNNHKLQKFDSTDSTFHSKFDLKGNKITDMEILNTNFNELVNAHNSQYQNFSVEKCIFKMIVVFEKCIFANKIQDKKAAKFKYVTFEETVNFRNTKFKGGLDIENININEPPNFLKSYVEPTNTNRETFRIIKHSFDRVGNHLEANHFFALEMEQYREDIKESGTFWTKAIYCWNKYTSNYGQSYITPMLWIAGLSVLYCLIYCGYKENLLYNINPNFTSFFTGISSILNSFAKGILPFNRTLICNLEFISLIFNILFAGLIWQTIVAIKRHTRR